MTSESHPDSSLQKAERAAQGDRQALEDLLDQHLPELRAYVRLHTGPMLRARESTSDLVQSVCREILQHQERFQFPSESAFRQWLFTTALRKIGHRAEALRTQRRDVRREVRDAAADGSLLDCYRTFSTPSRRALLREEIERMEHCFDQLGEEHRKVITHAYLIGMSRADMAKEWGRSEGAIRVLLHRALARLSMLMGSGEPEDERPPGGPDERISG